jgi:plastocyanin
MLTRALLPAALLAICCAGTAVLAAGPVAVVQKGRAFATRALAVQAGQVVRFLNEDLFIHQIYIQSDSFKFDSDEQEPGREVDVRFPSRGTFQVRCQIHPKMLLQIDVQ